MEDDYKSRLSLGRTGYSCVCYFSYWMLSSTSSMNRQSPWPHASCRPAADRSTRIACRGSLAAMKTRIARPWCPILVLRSPTKVRMVSKENENYISQYIQKVAANLSLKESVEIHKVRLPARCVIIPLICRRLAQDF
jgi:hypothetical protein